jgi:hypothetical protein
MTVSTSRAARARGGSKFEVYMWFFTRVSGILFLLMGAFNLVYGNLLGGRGNMDVGAQMRWAFFPISFHVESTAVEVTPNFLEFLLAGIRVPSRGVRHDARLQRHKRHPAGLRPPPAVAGNG